MPVSESGNGKSRIFIRSQNSQLLLSTGKLLEDVKSNWVLVKFIVPDHNAIFNNTGLIDIFARCLIPKSANVGKTDKGRPVIYQKNKVASDSWFVLPFELTTLLKYRGAKVKQFLSPKGRFPFETVAITDRGGVRRVLAGCLRSLCSSLNIPYIHLSNIPRGYRAIFGFRVDTDLSTYAEIIDSAKIAEMSGMGWTWFITTAHIKDNLKDLVKVLSCHDIQLHGHRHLVYRDFDRNYRNFTHAIKILETAGVTPVGVAAPYGEWHKTLNSVFIELGLEYSSEFGYDYDDTPSRPIVDCKESQILQIPVHPISLGRLAWAKMEQEQMIEYYKRIIDLQVVRGEPCFLYDHPGMIVRYPQVISEVIRYGLERCGNWITMSDYCRWWQKRERVHFSCWVNEKEIELEVEKGSPDVLLVVEHQQKVAQLELCSGRYALESLQWQPLQILPFSNRELKTRQHAFLLSAHELIRQIRRGLQIIKESL
ncbi:MAG: hypothetical protein ACUVUR_05960 [bacterium]